MAILSANTSLTRYRITDDIPETLWAQIPELLQRHCFQEIDSRPDERSFGWTPFDNPLDSDWQGASLYKGEFIAFALRLDIRRLPAAVLKKYYQRALEDLRSRNEAKGRNFVSREEKKELREQTRLKLMRQILPIPASFDVVWNISTQYVFLSSTTRTIRELFEEHFTQTFDLHLELSSPFFYALNLLGHGFQDELTNYEPCLFV
jgi:DNA recombination-dependent growth factor C